MMQLYKVAYNSSNSRIYSYVGCPPETDNWYSVRLAPKHHIHFDVRFRIPLYWAESSKYKYNGWAVRSRCSFTTANISYTQ